LALQLNWKYIHDKVFIVCFSGSKKKKRSKKKEKEVPNEVDVKHNDVEVHEEEKCDIPDEKPATGRDILILGEYKYFQTAFLHNYVGVGDLVR
jgi:hypothetical protein